MADYVITEPGVYDIPEDVYHADPVPEGSLSQSGAKKLLAEGGPALFAWERDHPQVPSEAMELGTAAHRLVLGTGPELAEVRAKDWRTKAAQEAAAQAREAGAVPLLTRDMETVRAMADALRAHPGASAYLSLGRGQPERSAFWKDETFGIWRRCRWDLMPDPGTSRRPVIADYKTAHSAARKDFAKAAANYGYHMQADWYCAGYVAMFGASAATWPAFVFVVQEKTAPYRVACYQLPASALELGRARNEEAMGVYRECSETGEWPGYAPDVEWLDLPAWAYREDY